jgi:SAM-dependent methyltransferase
MHASSLENMYRCHARYLPPKVLQARGEMTVLDVGGADVNGGYREVFADPQFQYKTVDLAEGNGVDIVLEDPYRFPVEDHSVDIVLSGQMLEHCEFFWLSFAEMMRVLKPDGFLFLIAPSAGPIHRYPVDCYRFYPDAYRALAKYAGCQLLEVWLDERGPWRDLVGVFSWQEMAEPVAYTPPIRATAPLDVAPGAPEEEAVQGSTSYLQVLERLHAVLEPPVYLEIGVRHGRSLALAKGIALGVDPDPEVAEWLLPPTTRLISLASDDFFRDVAAAEMPAAPDLVFIDGMHLFEYALRDFMHVERMARPGTLVVIDDILPSHPTQAERNRRSRVWTGDIWKLQRCLAELRPDLTLLALDTSPTGLLLIAGLDPANRVLWDRYNPIVRQYRAEQTPPREVLERTDVLDPADARVAAVLATLRQCRSDGSTRAAVVTRLRAALAKGAAAE